MSQEQLLGYLGRVGQGGGRGQEVAAIKPERWVEPRVPGWELSGGCGRGGGGGNGEGGGGGFI